ncbi:hypothetical protein [Streptomyces beihaiensis]|uniref:Peptidase inhibitor family I36 n=1 Tax=Streptomyces beihaiensis TaxID=2984495 RepID=A0ABT3TR11_9ACTN|nr:hypothetical protein [Streptomyces beihaiensis]MCX3059466.1 hypothetical protein [Streptomyces beihaiensis]
MFATTAAGALLWAPSAHAATDSSVSAQGTYEGCPSGYVCMYPNASWNGGVPEHKYYTYGVHKLYNEYGSRRIFNNQTGGATERECKNSDGTNCGSKLLPWTYRDVDITPINSIRLDPS